MCVDDGTLAQVVNHDFLATFTFEENFDQAFCHDEKLLFDSLVETGVFMTKQISFGVNLNLKIAGNFFEEPLFDFAEILDSAHGRNQKDKAFTLVSLYNLFLD